VILNNWVAKLLSLVLAVILWSVIRQSLATTGLPSRFQFERDRRFQAEEKFQFDANSYGNPQKK
jgi:hypothetical protein